MRYAFIINPKSGNGKGGKKIIEALSELKERDDRDIRIYETGGPEDATILAGSLVREANEAGEEIRIYSCGGDGTSYEVLNGIVGFDNVSLGIVPTGSGNDLLRNFGESELFKDVEEQLDAESFPIDILSIEEEGRETKYYLNSLNIGFDGYTARMANELKRRRIASGTLSYLISVAGSLVKKPGAELRVSADGELVYDGKMLLCMVANGGYCGSGFNANPKAVLNDGLVELFIAEDMSRRRFVNLVPRYRAGKLLEIEGVESFTRYLSCKEVCIEPKGGEMAFVVDGESYESGNIKIKLLESAVKLLIPKTISLETEME